LVPSGRRDGPGAPAQSNRGQTTKVIGVRPRFPALKHDKPIN
jgi:hypothetical protein